MSTMRNALFLGCLTLLVAAASVDATVVTYVASDDVYIEWTVGDHGVVNRNGKGRLVQETLPLTGYDSVCKVYMKFDIPDEDSWLVNAVTLTLTNATNESGSLNPDDPVEIWALPDEYDGWVDDTLDWDMAVASYANPADPNDTSFTAGGVVGTGTLNSGKGVPTDITIDPAALAPYLAADTNNQITLCIRPTEISYWCDRESGGDPNAPQLTWDYIPEPASLSLLALGALAALRRRRA